MDFYTTVERYGNNLLYRGYSGTERVQKKIPFRPTLFVRSDKGSWKNLQGQPVEPIEFDSMREATDFIKRYDGISNMEVYGQNNYITQFISQRFPKDISFNRDAMNIVTFDIEVQSDEGFPEPDQANFPIISIALKSSKSDKFIVFGLNEYEVIAGERRLRSSKMAGLGTIPCLVDQKKDQDALVSALIENLQREDLNPVEEARGLDRLKREFGLTQDEVATSTGKARSTIANSLRILSLPTSVLDLLSEGKIEKGHAKLLASMPPSDAEKMARKIIKESLTVKDLSNVSLKNKSKNSPKSKQKDTDMLNIEQEMSESFGHKVEIETKNKKSGKVTIFYKSLDELDNIIAKIKK